jgi:hypothetical protein
MLKHHQDGLLEIVQSGECDLAGWYRLDELRSLGVNDEIHEWSRRAIAVVPERLSPLPANSTK